MAKIIIAKWIIVVMKYLDDNEVKVHIVKSYVDDIRWLLECIASGVIWCNITKSYYMTLTNTCLIKVNLE